jgi:hypothetical protein
MKRYRQSNQEGFVAIIVASILMVIMTLITIGFTQIMQREQRQALDRQLSTQAYYAAETAVNDFYVALQAAYADPTTYSFPEKQKFDCSTADFPAIDGGKLDGEEGDISYTCLQYDLDPETIELNNGSIETDQSKVVPIRLSDSSGGNNIQQITLGWEHQDGSFNLGDETSCGVDQNNFPSTRPESVPIMRIDLLRLPRSGSGQPINQQDIIEETPNLYLSPKSGCGTNETNFSEHDEPDEKGKIVQVNCAPNDEGRDCELQINIDLPAGRMTDQYVMRLRSIYANANATISAQDTLTGDRTELTDAQVLVDATGKANDIVRRIQVRLQAIERQETEYSIPEPVFQAMEGFCKVLTVTPVGSVGEPDGRVNLNSNLCTL